MKNSNLIKIVALILVAILWLGVMAGLVAYAYQDNTAATTTAIELNIPVSSNTAIMPEASNDNDTKRVFLEDRSGSAEGIFADAKLDYDVVVPFSTYLWQEDANSQIITSIYNALTIVDELGVGTDLKSYPYNEAKIVEGKEPLKGKEVVVYMAKNSLPEQYQNAVVNLSKMLDEATCTLKFVNYRGDTYATIYDNYQSGEATAVPAPVVENQEIKVNISTPAPATTGFTRTDVALLMGIMFTIVMALVVVIICMIDKKNCNNQPASTQAPGTWQAPVATAIANGDAVVCDFSGSMDWLKDAVCKYIQTLGVLKVWSFNDTIKELTVKKARRKRAEGNTYGYKMICHLHTQSVKRFVLVSDMNFNDNPSKFSTLQPGTFEHITFVIPKDESQCNMEILEAVKMLADSTTIAYLEN